MAVSHDENVASHEIRCIGSAMPKRWQDYFRYGGSPPTLAACWMGLRIRWEVKTSLFPFFSTQNARTRPIWGGGYPAPFSVEGVDSPSLPPTSLPSSPAPLPLPSPPPSPERPILGQPGFASHFAGNGSRDSWESNGLGFKV